MGLKRHFFPYILITFIVLMVAASFYRFMVSYDYLVYYDDVCDPYATNACFVYCEDEACVDPIYYVEIVRRADVLVSLCGGASVLDCPAAYECQPGESECSISTCDPAVDGELCEDLSESDRPPDKIDEVGSDNNESEL